MIKFFVGVIVLILSIWIIIHFAPKLNASWIIAPTIGGIAFLASLVIMLYSIITPLEFRQFEKKFEIQKAQYEMIADSGLKLDGIMTVVDIMSVNEELAEYQASREMWGWWSSVPDRVMDMTPIGS